MKVLTILAAFIFAIFLVSSTPKITADVSAQDGKKPPEVITLGADAKLGSIKFNHLDHITKKRSADGTCQIACVECHHTDQPKEKLTPPLMTSERNVSLTADVLKDAAAAPVKGCRSCHLQAGDDSKPLPVIKKDGKDLKLDNEVAYHTNCFACHDAAIKARPDLATKISGSDPKGCVKCHVAK